MINQEKIKLIQSHLDKQRVEDDPLQRDEADFEGEARVAKKVAKK